jgi:hypothetical protein
MSKRPIFQLAEILKQKLFLEVPLTLYKFRAQRPSKDVTDNSKKGEKAVK